jgi:hypothetical protein
MAHPVCDPQAYMNHFIYMFFFTSFHRSFPEWNLFDEATEQGGVVDARLNVYGVQNLKVPG